MSRYQQLMEDLHPQVIIAKTEVPYDTAYANYSLQSSIVSSYAEFEEEVITFIAYVMLNTVGSYLPPEFLLDKARNFLDRKPGFDNAVIMAMSGADGGLMAVLQLIVLKFKEEARQSYYQYILDSYIDPMNFEQIVEIMTEFKQRLSAYTDDAFDFISPEQMAGQYKQILWDYIEKMSSNRNLWRFVNNQS